MSGLNPPQYKRSDDDNDDKEDLGLNVGFGIKFHFLQYKGRTFIYISNAVQPYIKHLLLYIDRFQRKSVYFWDFLSEKYDTVEPRQTFRITLLEHDIIPKTNIALFIEEKNVFTPKEDNLFKLNNKLSTKRQFCKH